MNSKFFIFAWHRPDICSETRFLSCESKGRSKLFEWSDQEFTDKTKISKSKGIFSQLQLLINNLLFPILQGISNKIDDAQHYIQSVAKHLHDWADSEDDSKHHNKWVIIILRCL